VSKILGMAAYYQDNAATLMAAATPPFIEGGDMLK
jgi:hypothetical protein